MFTFYQIIDNRIIISGDTFKYKDKVKALGGVWEPKTKTWSILLSPAVFSELISLGIKEKVSENVAANVSSPIANMDNITESATKVEVYEVENSDNKVWSVRDFVVFLQDIFKKNVQGEYWIWGEVTNLRVVNQHAYFELAEQLSKNGEETRVGKPVSLGCTMWAGVRKRLMAKFPELPLIDGMKIKVLVTCDLRIENTKIVANVTDMDVEYTLGDLALQKQNIVKKLKKLKAYDLNKTRTLPAFPLKIALITSIDSRAKSDFMDELERSGLGFTVTIFDCSMQGTGSSIDIRNALQLIQTKYENNFACIVITRGGGSRLDLRWFDDFDLAYAIALLPIPVITAIGHFEDSSVADEVAWLAEKTPTGAARFLSEMVLNAWDDLQEKTQICLDNARKRLTLEGQNLARIENLMLQIVKHRIIMEQKNLGNLESLLIKLTRFNIERNKVKLQSFAQIIKLLHKQNTDILAKGYALVLNSEHKIMSVDKIIEQNYVGDLWLKMFSLQEHTEKLLQVKLIAFSDK